MLKMQITLGVNDEWKLFDVCEVINWTDGKKSIILKDNDNNRIRFEAEDLTRLMFVVNDTDYSINYSSLDNLMGLNK